YKGVFMTQMIINGIKTDAISKLTIDVIDPSNGKSFATIPRGNTEDVDNAVRAARVAFSEIWSQTTACERGRLLYKLSQKILEHTDRLAELESRDTGKPISTAKNDVITLARYFEFYAGGVDKIHGQTIP